MHIGRDRPEGGLWPTASHVEAPVLERELLDTPITSLGLGLRTTLMLRGIGVLTVGDLNESTLSDLRQCRCFSERRLQEIRDAWHKLGMALSDTPPPNSADDVVPDAPRVRLLEAGSRPAQGDFWDRFDRFRSDPRQHLDEGIAVLDLCPSVTHRLRDGGYLTVGSLIARSEEQLIRIPSYDARLVGEVRDRLRSFGLDLRTEARPLRVESPPQGSSREAIEPSTPNSRETAPATLATAGVDRAG